MANLLKELVCLLTEHRIPYVFNVEPDESASVGFDVRLDSPIKTIYCHDGSTPVIMCYMMTAPYVNPYKIDQRQYYFHSVDDFKASMIFRMLKDSFEEFKIREANAKFNRLFNSGQ